MTKLNTKNKEKILNRACKGQGSGIGADLQIPEKLCLERRVS